MLREVFRETQREMTIGRQAGNGQGELEEEHSLNSAKLCPGGIQGRIMAYGTGGTPEGYTQVPQEVVTQVSQVQSLGEEEVLPWAQEKNVLEV